MPVFLTMGELCGDVRRYCCEDISESLTSLFLSVTRTLQLTTMLHESSENKEGSYHVVEYPREFEKCAGAIH